MSKFTDQIEGAEPEGGSPLFKFEKPGDLVIAEFRGRRTVKTKASKDGVPGRALDVTIIESKVDGRPGPTGPATVFESGHVTQLLDGAAMEPGDAFALRYHSQDRVSRFKKFAFKKYSKAETAELLGELPDEELDEPPEGFFDR